METLETMAREEMVRRGPMSRAYYKRQATKKLAGRGILVKKKKLPPKIVPDRMEQQLEEAVDGVTSVFFNPGEYTVVESVGTFNVTVSRKGGDLELVLLVDYKTEDATANAGEDYVAKS
jgi:solute carrier family 8 (sodium/calcium exchanger)